MISADRVCARRESKDVPRESKDVPCVAQSEGVMRMNGTGQDRWNEWMKRAGVGLRVEGVVHGGESLIYAAADKHAYRTIVTLAPAVSLGRMQAAG